MATAYHNLSDYDFNSVPDASEMRFGIVVSEWNSNITGALLDGAVKTLKKHGAKDENIHAGTTQGIAHLNATTDTPVIYGLITTNNMEQAEDRAGGKLGNKGDECAITAIKMIDFTCRLKK